MSIATTHRLRENRPAASPRPPESVCESIRCAPGMPILLSCILHVLACLLVVGWISRTRPALVCVFELCASLALGSPEQPDFAVWLQERHRAEPNGSERGRRPPIRARFVVITTMLQSRITPPGDGTGGREARSQWCERMVRTGWDTRRD